MTLRRVEKVVAFWNRQALDSRYQSEFGAGMLIKDASVAEHRRRTEESRFRNLVELSSDAQVLDVGCGTGRWSFFLAPSVGHVVAIDLIDEMIEVCRRIQTEHSIANVEFHVRPATEIGDLGAFELIHAGGVLQYLTDDEVVAFARLVVSQLLPGGTCVTRDSVTRVRRELHGDYPVVYRTDSEYEQLFAAGGMRRIRSERAYILPAIVGRLNRIIPLRGRWLEYAILLDNFLMRHWPATWLLRVYAKLTGRGCGEVPDHRFFVYVPSQARD